MENRISCYKDIVNMIKLQALIAYCLRLIAIRKFDERKVIKKTSKTPANASKLLKQKRPNMLTHIQSVLKVKPRPLKSS